MLSRLAAGEGRSPERVHDPGLPRQLGKHLQRDRTGECLGKPRPHGVTTPRVLQGPVHEEHAQVTHLPHYRPVV